MDSQTVAKKIAELKEELRKARFDLALNKLKDTSKIRKTRKEIARFFSQINNVKATKKSPVEK